MNPSVRHPLAAYLPRLLLESLATGTPPPIAPDAETFDGATLLADVSGYTAMTEAACARPDGPERVRDVLDRCFGRVIDEVTLRGGDVLNFAGDAVIAIWRGAGAVAAATQCARAIQAETDGSAEAPRLRIGVGAGSIALMRAGGVHERWLMVAGGEPFTQMGLAARSGQPGGIVLSAAARDELLKGGAGGKLKTPPPSLPAPGAPLDPWVPPLVATRLAQGQGDWHSELRTVSVVFALLPRLDCGDTASRACLQTHTVTAQQVVDRYEGMVAQVIVDDNGLVVVLAFGVPTAAHPDDATRATRAALDLQACLTELAQPHGIGVSTGLAFCGAYGNDRRRAYAVVGDTVNFAARLAQHESGVLCDEPTTRGVRATSPVTFEPLEPLRVKGTASPRAAFRVHPGRSNEESREATPRTPPRNVHLVGREADLAALQSRLEVFQSDRKRREPLVIEGDAGLGKTRLCTWLAEEAAARGFTVITTTGDALETSTPYWSWRRILLALFGIPPTADASTVSEVVAAGEPPDHPGWSPLLAPILRIDIPESETTQQMSGRVRGEATRQLLSALVRHRARTQPLVLIFDDAQWLDASSRELLMELCRLEDGPLLLIALRTTGGEPPSSVAGVRAAPGTTIFHLADLSGEDVRALLLEELDTQEIAPEIVDFVFEKSHGNPFFARELASALRQSGALLVEPRGTRLAGSRRALEELPLPPTLAGLMTHQLDRLSPEELMLLKVGSVIGQAFSPRTLQGIHPEHPDTGKMLRLCELLCDQGMLVPGPLSLLRESSFQFRHSIIKDTAYQLMPFAQRRTLHGATARWVEQYQPGPAGYGLRAHHWRAAEERTRLLEALELAGGDALGRGASQEAAEIFNEALSLEAVTSASPSRRAQLHLQLGDALYRLGEVKRSLESLERAASLIGLAVPGSTFGWIRRGAVEVVTQIVHLIRTRRRPLPPDERQRQLNAARIWAIIAELHYFATRLPQMMVSLLSTVNLAERALAPELAARAYGILAYSAGLGRLHGLAANYFQRGKQGHDAHNVANTLYAEGLYELAFARWERCFNITQAGISLADSVGDDFSTAMGRTIMAAFLQHRGRVAEALRLHEDVIASARRRSNPQHEVWGLTGAAECLVSQGRPDDALARLAEAAPLMSRADALSGVRFEGVRAWALLRRGDHDAARTARDATLALLRQGQQPMYAWFYALTGIVEIGITLHSVVGGEQSTVRESFAALRRFALVMPFAQTHVALLRGRWAACQGAVGTAQNHWRRALALSQRYELPCEADEAQRALRSLTAASGSTASAILPEAAPRGMPAGSPEASEAGSPARSNDRTRTR